MTQYATYSTPHLSLPRSYWEEMTESSETLKLETDKTEDPQGKAFCPKPPYLNFILNAQNFTDQRENLG